MRDAAGAELALGADSKEFLDPKLRERAALLLARKAISSNNEERYHALRQEWENQSHDPDLWFLVEADRIIQSGKPNSARKFLEQRKLEGRNEALRLARLALLEAQNPEVALARINAGLIADPRNSDLLSFRAQVVEAAGKPAAARVDYVAAVLADRKNPIHRDALARFYLRRGSYTMAIET